LIKLPQISTQEILLKQTKIATVSLDLVGRHTILATKPEKLEKCRKDRILLIEIVSDKSKLPAINLEIHLKSDKTELSASKKVQIKAYPNPEKKQSQRL